MSKSYEQLREEILCGVREERDEYREILKDILDIEAEIKAELERAPHLAVPTLQTRKALAWARAWEKFEP